MSFSHQTEYYDFDLLDSKTADFAQGKQKFIFGKEPIRDTVVYVVNPLKNYVDLYNLAVMIRLSENSMHDEKYVFLGQRIRNESGRIIGHRDNRSDVIIKLVKDAAEMGHELAKEWLKTLCPSDEKTSTATMLRAISPTDEKLTVGSPAERPNSATPATELLPSLTPPLDVIPKSSSSSDGSPSGFLRIFSRGVITPPSGDNPMDAVQSSSDSAIAHGFQSISLSES